MSGRVPFGLRRQRGKLVPHPVEAAVVREVAEAFLRAGGRLKTAAADLNARGFRTRKDARWTDTAVGRVLRVVSHEGVVPAAVRERCLAVLREREATPDAAARRPVHPLGAVIECACSARMYQEESGGAKFVCRACRLKIPVDTLERVFAESLAAVEIDADEIVNALGDNPRAAELTRRLGGCPVAVSQVWSGLDPGAKRLVVEAAVSRVIVDKDEVSVVFGLEADSGPEAGAFSEDALPSSDGSEGHRKKATNQPDDPPGNSATSRGELPLLLTAEKAAEVLQTTTRGVYAMCERGLLPGVVRVGRRLLIRRDELLDSLSRSRAPSPKENRR